MWLSCTKIIIWKILFTLKLPYYALNSSSLFIFAFTILKRQYSIPFTCPPSSFQDKFTSLVSHSYTFCYQDNNPAQGILDCCTIGLLPSSVPTLIRVSPLFRAAGLSINSSILIFLLIGKAITGFSHTLSYNMVHITLLAKMISCPICNSITQ